MDDKGQRHVLVTGTVRRINENGHVDIGIPDVTVTDGARVTRTDATGRYRLPVARGRRHTELVYLTVPAGWEAPTDRSQVPRFYRHVDAGLEDVEGVDFLLRRNPATERENFRFVALADVHVQAGAINTTEGFSHQLDQLNTLRHELADGAGPPSFITVAGDLTNHATPAEFADYLAATAVSSVPVWCAPGNHDLQHRAPGGPHPRKAPPQAPYRDAIEGYRQALGPEWYSFQYGNHHFVVLENYRGLGEADQLAWLQQDLEANATNKRVVVISHVPWNVPQTPGPELTDGCLGLLSRYDVQLLLAGHTHSNDVATGVIDGAVQAVTTSPGSTLDQTPQGFRIVEFCDDRVETPFGEFDAHREPTVVSPTGVVSARERLTVRVTRYRPPLGASELEYRVPPGPWRPLQPRGRRAWTADIDTALPTGGSRHLDVRTRDLPDGAWSETRTGFDVATEPVTRPRQGTPWPMFHRDARHSGTSCDVVAPPLRLAWGEHSGGTILTSSVAVDHDGVFVGVRDEDGTRTNGVLALDITTGEARWNTATDGPVEASVAVTDGLVLAPAARGPLLALEVDTGRVRWQWAPPPPDAARCWMYYSPTVQDGIVYQAYSTTSGTWVVALDARTGHPKWHTTEPLGRNWICHASPAVDGDLLVFATAYGNLVSLDATTGQIRWQAAQRSGLVVRAKPVLVDEIALLACHGDRLVAVDAQTGAPRWSHRSGGISLLPDFETTATPAVADGIVHAGFSDGSVTALRLETGELIWQVPTHGAVLSSPAISGQTLYVGSNDGRFRALDRATGDLIWEHDFGTWVASSPAVTGNTVITAAWDGTVYAFTGQTPTDERQPGGSG